MDVALEDSCPADSRRGGVELAKTRSPIACGQDVVDGSSLRTTCNGLDSFSPHPHVHQCPGHRHGSRSVFPLDTSIGSNGNRKNDLTFFLYARNILGIDLAFQAAICESIASTITPGVYIVIEDGGIGVSTVSNIF